jgi:hypothetical protein
MVNVLHPGVELFLNSNRYPGLKRLSIVTAHARLPSTFTFTFTIVETHLLDFLRRKIRWPRPNTPNKPSTTQELDVPEAVSISPDLSRWTSEFHSCINPRPKSPHAMPGGTRYQCQVCQLTYSSNSHLRRHEAVRKSLNLYIIDRPTSLAIANTMVRFRPASLLLSFL